MSQDKTVTRTRYTGKARLESPIAGIARIAEAERCWNCRQPGTPRATTRVCVACDVEWRAVPAAILEPLTQVLWMGTVIPAVDFTSPAALGAPA